MTLSDDTYLHHLYKTMLEFEMQNGEIQFAQGKEEIMKERVLRLQSHAYRTYTNLSTEPSLTSGSSNTRTETHKMSQRMPATPSNMSTLHLDHVPATASMVVREKAINQANPFLSDTMNSAAQQHLLSLPTASTQFDFTEMPANTSVPGQFTSPFEFMNGTEATGSNSLWPNFTTQPPSYDPTTNYMPDNFNGQAQ